MGHPTWCHPTSEADQIVSTILPAAHLFTPLPFFYAGQYLHKSEHEVVSCQSRGGMVGSSLKTTSCTANDHDFLSWVAQIGDPYFC